MDGEPVKALLSLSTGRCTPLDDLAERIVLRPWFGAAIAEYVDWLRERVRRAAAQCDRETSFRTALEDFEPGAMMPYDRLFPADWDLLLRHEDKTYWAVDNHCLNATCPCAEIVIGSHDIETRKPRYIGEARLNLNDRRPKPTASTPLAAEIFAVLWERSRDELLRRRHEVRCAVLRRASARALTAQPFVTVASHPVVARNAPCPCGSGKKFKRCCAGRREVVDPPG